VYTTSRLNIIWDTSSHYSCTQSNNPLDSDTPEPSESFESILGVRNILS
jgi:hypothetical protein